MQAPDSEIRDVSDTALWVAAHRALESERADAAFRDPLAQQLVGARGHALRQAMPGSQFMHWIMVLRTVALDDLIQAAIAQGADTIINLGAGLDTRPYRLPLPATLRWFEIDLPNIVALKQSRLQSETPVCALERIGLDLTHRQARNELLTSIASSARSVAVLTEGLLPYLDPAEVESLAGQLRSLPAIRFWIQDYYNAVGDSSALRAWRDRLRAAPFKFEVPDWIGYFRSHGWAVMQRISVAQLARRLARRPPLSGWRLMLYALTPVHVRRRLELRAGYLMLGPGPD